MQLWLGIRFTSLSRQRSSAALIAMLVGSAALMWLPPLANTACTAPFSAQAGAPSYPVPES